MKITENQTKLNVSVKHYPKLGSFVFVSETFMKKTYLNILREEFSFLDSLNAHLCK